ncbi:MAG: LPS-assembly protein LptD [Alphaproteobacteria bacterium]
MLLVLALTPTLLRAQTSGAFGTDDSGTGGSGAGAADLQAPILFQADSLNYDGETRLWTALGNVEASQNGRVLSADSVTYDEETGTVRADGNVRLTDPQGPTAFAESAIISGDLRSGIINSLSLVFAENTRLAAARATRGDDGLTVLEKAVYSPCKVCEEKPTPFWQFKARRVVHDQNRRSVSYRHARFEIKGVPIGYLPYFSHPDPTVGRKSGLLTPTVGNSTELGEQAEIPYFINLRPNMDLTLSPLFTTEEGVVGKAIFRHRTRRGRYELSGSIANAQVFDEGTGAPEGRSLRGHVFGEGRFQLSPFNQWGYELELTTDDTYLRRFNISRADRLTNNVFFRRYEADGDRTTYDGFFFDGLRVTDDDATTPIVPALIEHREVFENPILGGTVSIDLNALSLFRTASFDGDLATNGVDTQRGSLQATWERRTVSAWGDVLTLTTQGRADIYYAQDTEFVAGTTMGTDEAGNPILIPTLRDEDVTQHRLVALAAADWRWPFVKGAGDKRHVIEPIVQLIYSPLGGNPDDIPNEDSLSFEFDDTNLFTFNRFAGLDVWESGPRANVGLRYATYGTNFSAGVLLGQSIRLREQSEFPDGSGIENEFSDYVGRINFRAGNLIDFRHRFRLDRQTFEFSRNEIDLDFQTKHVGVTAGYLSIEPQIADPLPGITPPVTLLDDRQEIRLEGRTRFTDNWSVRGGARRDLEDGEMISNFASLIYRNDCTVIEGLYRRTFTQDRDVAPETSILFRFRLLNSSSAGRSLF